jgi:hypothetical protein
MLIILILNPVYVYIRFKILSLFKNCVFVRLYLCVFVIMYFKRKFVFAIKW